MRIGVPRERGAGERRVALVPDSVRRLVGRGNEVVVESGAGLGASFPDDAYVGAGASVVSGAEAWAADLVAVVGPPTLEEVRSLRRGAALVGFLAPLTSPELLAAIEAAGAVAFAMEAIPRTSRAQSMDALSSQASVAGYRAALIGAELLPRFFPMLVTAAGTVPPARVLVLGAGVAGLQALATARRLGAQTTGYDVRPEVAEQVRSLGAGWLDLGIEAAGEGGYARQLTEEERAAQQQALGEAIKRFDVVITTALVPGRPAPKLVTADACRGMRPGSVVVDLAGETGGNCELSVPGETVVRDGVTIAAPLNLPASLPEHASQLYARNVVALLELLVGEGGAFAPDFSDDIVAKACVAGGPGRREDS
ncbi:MAG TPA: Re/Si-specific NAD(P)(+) transhydrogenase subunit alpha [Acidimicrobiales bacterium]|jgi:NAD(P) transhydrogenase subunit alpha|nr:Re/Si-specific NAD(P)(+) transhydrogenase subunit alpha [Acidimicrobiales bacterium]